MLHDRLVELHPLLGIVTGVLEGGTGHADRLGTHGGPGRLEGLHGRLGVARLALPHAGQALVELLPTAEQARAGDADVFEDDLGSVAGADAVLRELLALCEARRVRGYDERGVTPAAEFRVDDGDDHVHVGDATVADPGLGAVEHPLVGRLVVDGPGAHGRHVGPGVGLR